MNGQHDNTVKKEGAPLQIPVLVVEDSIIQSELLRRVLAREGYSVTIAKDGAEGLAIARKELPKIIISDIHMPEMNGFEMCEAVRKDASLRNIPVILLTMLTEVRDVVHGLNAGADYYVTKPFNEQYLLSKIKVALNKEPWYNEKKIEVEINIGEEKFRVRSGHHQVMDLLVSIYENAVLQNLDLMNAQDQLKKLTDRLEEKAEKLEEANRDLEEFAYSVSHDMRVPLRAIDGFSYQVLKHYEDKLDDEGPRYLNVVRDNTKKMSRLIDDILAFSRMGRLRLSVSEVNMEKLAYAVFDELKPGFAGRELAIEIKPLPFCHGDLAMLRQVWINLLGNAIKFTRNRDAAVVEVGGHAEGREIIYYVKDNGAGFDMRYADKLFGLFQRLHKVEEFEGTGIGLAIVNRIVKRHGGRLWGEGKVDEGATFYFTLPYK